MVVSGIVKKDVNEPLGRIHQRDRYQQRDPAQGVNRRRFDHTGCAGFQIDGAVNVQSLSPAGLFKSDFGVLRRPTARWPHLVRGMHSIGKQYGFIIAQIVEQIVISLDKSPLPCGISLRGITSRLRNSTSIRAKSLIRAKRDSSRHRTFRFTRLPWWSSAATFTPPSLSTRPAAPPSVRRRGLCSRNRPTNSALLAKEPAPIADSCYRPGREPSRSPRIAFHRRAAATHWVASARLSLPIPHQGDQVRSDRRIKKPPKIMSAQEIVSTGPYNYFSLTMKIGVYIRHAFSFQLAPTRSARIAASRSDIAKHSRM